MTVTIVCDVLGEPNNGTTIATLNLINYLKERGHTVYVVCGDEDKYGLDGYYILPKLNLGWFLNKVVARNGVSLAKVDKRILTEAIGKADVVQIQFPFSIGQTAAKIAVKMHKPITASFHCQAENFTAHIFMVNNALANKITYEVFYHTLYKYCDCVHYPTAFIRSLFEKTTHKTNGFVISNGVGPLYVNRHLVHNNKKFTIVSTGRFSTEKAQHVLIRAAAASKYKDNLRLCFAGEGPLKSVYVRLAKKLHVDASFNFYSREDLVTLLNRADLYVHPAFIEIEAIACIEAICCGLVPVIADARRSATKAFALDENNLFKENNVKSLASKIDFWYEHPALKAEYAVRYESLAGRFSQKKCMEGMENMLQTAVGMHMQDQKR
jgi:glycosyltransferase involved in cell wall biosynthesis